MSDKKIRYLRLEKQPNENRDGSKRKPIFETVTFDFGKPVSCNGVRYCEGRFEPLFNGTPIKPQQVHYGAYRKRANGKKDKNLVKIPVDPYKKITNEIYALSYFDRIFAVDTGTKELDGTKVSIGYVIECRLKKTHDGAFFDPFHRACYEFRGVQEKQENFAWHILICSIIHSPDYSSDDHYAIITDSDLGAHEDYNTRNKPYFSNHYLPINFTLLYAYDQSVSLSNQAIKLCDKEASRILGAIENNNAGIPKAKEVVDGICTHFHGHLFNKHPRVKPEGWFIIPPSPCGVLDDCLIMPETNLKALETMENLSVPVFRIKKSFNRRSAFLNW